MDIEFLPKIEFNGIDEQPLKYPTRDICPIQDPLVAAELDAQIDALIKGNIYSLLNRIIYNLMQSSNLLVCWHRNMFESAFASGWFNR